MGEPAVRDALASDVERRARAVAVCGQPLVAHRPTVRARSHVLRAVGDQYARALELAARDTRVSRRRNALDLGEQDRPAVLVRQSTGDEQVGQRIRAAAVCDDHRRRVRAHVRTHAVSTRSAILAASSYLSVADMRSMLPCGPLSALSLLYRELDTQPVDPTTWILTAPPLFLRMASMALLVADGRDFSRRVAPARCRSPPAAGRSSARGTPRSCRM